MVCQVARGDDELTALFEDPSVASRRKQRGSAIAAGGPGHKRTRGSGGSAGSSGSSGGSGSGDSKSGEPEVCPCSVRCVVPSLRLP